VGALSGYLVLAPEPGELGADVEQPAGEGGGAAGGTLAGSEGAQVGGEGPAVQVVVLSTRKASAKVITLHRR
jgi:hypothetical protein